MQIQYPRPGVVQLTLHPYELATLVAAVRGVVEGAGGELSAEAADQMRRVLSSYEAAGRQAGGP